MKCISVVVNSKPFAEIKEDLKNKRDIMRNDFNLKVKEKMKKVEKAKQKMMKIKYMRGIFLYFNREKRNNFSFAEPEQRFWKIVAEKREEFINIISADISNYKNKKKLTTSENEIVNYLGLVLTTLKKYDKNYGKNIALTLNNVFCKDISLYICDFI